MGEKGNHVFPPGKDASPEERANYANEMKKGGLPFSKGDVVIVPAGILVNEGMSGPGENSPFNEHTTLADTEATVRTIDYGDVWLDVKDANGRLSYTMYIPRGDAKKIQKKE